MHGLGNDFVIIDNADNALVEAQASHFSPARIKQLADRNTGIGFDQLLIINPQSDQSHAHADFMITIYNADGSEAKQCGNGLRCIARLLHEQKRCDRMLSLATIAGIYPLTIASYDAITVTMDVPTITQQFLPLTSDIHVSLVSIGNPHAILQVDDIKASPALQKAHTIYHHPSFPDGINVGLVQITGSNKLNLRTLERGTGETLACGSNACAAVAAAITNQWVKDKCILVQCSKGQLNIRWDAPDQPMLLTGPATHVYEGWLSLAT